MKATTSATLTQRIDILRGTFISELPQRLGMISTEMTRATGGDPRAASLQRLFHTLTGTASTFGLPAIGALAAEAEEVCSSAELDLESVTYLMTILRDLENEVSALQAHATAA